MKLDAYTVVFLRRPQDAPDLSEHELDVLQEGHLAFHARMRTEGHVVFNGPLRDQPDIALRGIAIYRRSVEETRRLAQEDPSVQAGRLVPDVCTWLMPAGALGDRPAASVEEG